MAENINNNNVRNDEIDLIDLFRRMGRTVSGWLSAIGTAFLISSVFLIRRWFPLGVSLILGIGFSFFLWKTSDSFYTSDLVLKVNIKQTDEVISYVNRLHSFCDDKKRLSEALSISSDLAQNISDIQAFWVIDNGNDRIPDFVDYSGKHSIYDTVNVRMKDRFNLLVNIKTPQVITDVREGIIKFISTEPLFMQRNDLRKKQNIEMLSRLEYDILQLDSLQKVKYFEEARNNIPKSGGQMIFLQEQKTQLLHQDIYKLFEQKQRLQLENDIYADVVTVLSDFSIPAQQDNGITYYTKKIVPVFFILALLILILLANRNKLSDVYKKY